MTQTLSLPQQDQKELTHPILAPIETLQAVNTTPKQHTEDKLADYNNPEQIKNMIARNKDIINTISTRTSDEELQEELNDLTASL